MVRRGALMAGVVVLLLAACAPSDGDQDGPDSAAERAPEGQGGAPEPEPPSTPDSPASPLPPERLTPGPWDGSAEELAALGVVVTDGFSPHEHLGRTDGILNWPAREEMPEAIGDPPVLDGLGPLAVDARVERYPVSCVSWTRRIAGVDAGDGEAAGRIAQHILWTAIGVSRDFSRWFATEEDCEGIGETFFGDSYQELAEEPCVVPDGPELRCFVLADFGYPPAAAHTYLRHHQLVFDATTGERLALDALLAAAGLDPSGALEATQRIVRTVTSTRFAEVRQARPTADGLVFGFSPYEAGSFAQGTRDVLIPWELLQPLAIGDRAPLTTSMLAAAEWRPSCFSDRLSDPVALEVPEAGVFVAAPLVRGGVELVHAFEPTGVSAEVLTVDLSRVARMDLDGDGQDELAVATNCFLGNGNSQAIEVWGMDAGGEPVQLPPALEYSKFDGYVVDLVGEGDAVVVTMRVGAVGDTHPHLSGYPLLRISEHRLSPDGTSWVMTVRSTVDVGDV